MRQAIALLLFASGCAGSTSESVLRRDVDPALQQGDVPRAVAAYEGAHASDARRERLLGETVLWASLSSSDAGERLRATRIVAALGDPALDRELPRRVGDTDLRVKAAAALALAPDSPPAREALRALVAATDVEARATAAEGLPYFADAEAVAQMLSRDADPMVRARLAGVLQRAPKPVNAGALLSTLAGDADAGVRAQAVSSLAARGASGLDAVIDRALADQALPVRLAGVTALGKPNATASRTVKLAALGAGPDPYVALRAAVQLGHRGVAEVALSAVRAAIADARPEVRVAALNAAGELGDDGASLCEPLLHDPDLEVRLAAARALIATGHADRAMATLTAALSGPAALEAADELARLGAPKGRALLVEAAHSPDAGARRRALPLLAFLPGVRAELVHALADADVGVRLTAADALLRKQLRPWLR